MANQLALVTDLVNKILNAAIATGAGASYSVPESPTVGLIQSFGWQTVTTGTFTALSITLQGSLDGTNWTTLDTTTQVAGEYRAVTGKPVQFIRANVGTFTGGTNVSVLVVVGRA